MSRSSDVNVPTGWWAAELHWNRGLFEVFNSRCSTAARPPWRGRCACAPASPSSPTIST